MISLTGSRWRITALALALLGVPLALGVSTFLSDHPVRVGQPSPRTVIAPELIRVPDHEATDRARREAADGVEPVLVDDAEAKAAIVQSVRDAFAAASAVREPNDEGASASAAEQREALRERLRLLEPEGLTLLVGLSDAQLATTAAEAVAVAQELARQTIRPDRLEDVAGQRLSSELSVRSFPDDVAEQIVRPIVRGALRPTVRVDEEATASAREQAAADVAEVASTYPAGTAIVTAGEIVDPIQAAALEEAGLAGVTDPWRDLLEAFAVALVLTAAVRAYLRAYRPRVWRSSRRLVLLSSLFVLFAVILEAVTLLAPTATPSWLFLVPVGAVAMLATILFEPPVGVLVTVPVTTLVALTAPGEPGVVAFAAVASLFSVPLVSRLSRDGDLRRAAGRSTVGYVVLAGVFAAVFQPVETVGWALVAGLGNGVLTALIVNGLLPFLESVFGIVTATSLLNLADRNHPLLRELEQKALGSYNHSILVSTLVERAARAIDADSLLGSVAALYHDIGKVRRPYFFVENQFGIPNPHDDLEPEVSAVIIQEHVVDGVKMARSYRLPPEVVEGIATHHGTTLVTFFHRKAVDAANGQPVDEARFRYGGRKPSSREMAILMLADCCEGASRAAALANRNLGRDDLEKIVHRLVGERVDDGQLDQSALTFRELATVQESFIETLVGVYHPRITYPDPKVPELPAPRPAGAEPR